MGILLLAIVRRHKTTSGGHNQGNRYQAAGPGQTVAVPPVNQSKVLRNLIVLVAELETGTLAKPDEPNYGLVSTATETIQGFLNSVQLMGGGSGEDSRGASTERLGEPYVLHRHRQGHASSAHQSAQSSAVPSSGRSAQLVEHRARKSQAGEQEDRERATSSIGYTNHHDRDMHATDIQQQSAWNHQAGDNGRQQQGDLDFSGTSRVQPDPRSQLREPALAQDGQQQQQQQDPMLLSQFDLDTWDYEVGFWQSLADWSSVALDNTTIGHGNVNG